MPTIGSLIGGTPEGQAAIAAFGRAVAPIRTIANRGNALACHRKILGVCFDSAGRRIQTGTQSASSRCPGQRRSVPLTLNAPAQPISCDMVKAIKSPVLITVGSNTCPLWTLAAQTLQRCVPDGKLVILPNSNHDATVRNPAAFNRKLVNFLALH